jgi:Holliday junction DNA helicase RuvA
VTLGIHTRVTDDAIQLFGFHTPLERTLFEKMLTVNGVGPKVALSVLSGIEPRDLVRAVRQGDVARLTRIPGIGRKTADRLVLELKDRMPSVEGGDEAPRQPSDAARDDLLSALVNLGYQRASVEKTVDAVMRRVEGREFETLLKEILREIGRA